MHILTNTVVSILVFNGGLLAGLGELDSELTGGTRGIGSLNLPVFDILNLY